MHLLAARSTGIETTEEAVDIDLSPGEIVFLSAADSELSAFADAAGALPDDFPTLRLASLVTLAHPMSVDVALEKTFRHARLIVVRLLGGAAYWPHGVDALSTLARQGGPKLLIVPGEARWSEALAATGTVAEEDARTFWRYCVDGGRDNRVNALAFAAHLIGRAERPAEPKPIPLAGCYWPGEGAVDLEFVRARWADPAAPVAALVFYRSHLQDGATAPSDALVEALAARGLNPLPMFASSLRDDAPAEVVAATLGAADPAVVLSSTVFSAGGIGDDWRGTALDRTGAPVLQVVQAGSSHAGWVESERGLGIRDLAMNVVTTEIDGRILTRAISFKEEAPVDARTEWAPILPVPVPDRVAYVADLAANWARLHRTPAAERKVALVLANYPTRDGRLANGVGLDTPASTVAILHAMTAAGYAVEGAPETSDALMACLTAGPTNAPGSIIRGGGVTLSLDRYLRFFAQLPEEASQKVVEKWGDPAADPSIEDGAFRLAVHEFGSVAVAVQPARGYDRDPKATYHDPDLPPTHAYLAFHVWLRETFGADAIVQVGKHGNLEWLPGKALALSAGCFPEAALGPVPTVYPFIVNDPGEGSQAKRRTSSVIVDHLTPAMTRAESHGASETLEHLLDEFSLADAVDPRRAEVLRKDLVDLAIRHGFDRDIGVDFAADPDGALMALDAHICDLKELQIRDGLHILGASPEGRLRTDTLAAIARLPRGEGIGTASLSRALAADLGLSGFDPLEAELAAPWSGLRPAALAAVSDAHWRTAGDTIERIELLSAALIAGAVDPDPAWAETRAVLDALSARIAPALDRSGAAEIAAVLRALDGRFVAPGPSGAPTRGRTDVLPTGRNFFSVDVRAVPTEAAWRIGSKAAERVVERYVMEEGDWPRAIAFTCWGTANMRTGGDDVAQALALVGAKPTWDAGSGRVTGFEILPLSELRRPRVDVTLRVSGFFRDAFPNQIALFDAAVRAIGKLDEPADQNPIAVRMEADRVALASEGHGEEEAEREAGYRVFGSMPGAYGAGLQAPIDSGQWEAREELADVFLSWGGYAYGAGVEGASARGRFETQLARTDAVLQAQDNREHDILDSDDYYQFEGGMAAAVETLAGAAPVSLHVDTSRPERPIARTLGEEIGRVVRGRAANPKWIAGMMRHGYKGAFELAATVDYLFAFAATTNAVGDHHFDQLYDAYLEDETVRAFVEEKNPHALAEMAARLKEAIDRGMWKPRANSAYDRLAGWAVPARASEKETVT
ncbi:cobaltochelatase subunit CobN [Amorphus coralli]|uniref:cobaltochelatase subunit CobN n=1 Tax=Amorphus coralli TaxID=340680 RepID=UPI000375519D|nr:cobaltochelatase subunit CobN [Amorphus coralli]